ncbi:MAG: SatD family protein [Acidobacteriota bacterium]|nr:SatD family protein [Acidobacteriota bacterium]
MKLRELPEHFATVLGDVVDSRGYPDQASLLRELRRLLQLVNQRVPALQPLSCSVGDEFQGVYESLKEALLATLAVQLHAKGSFEVRFGLGWGPISVFSPEEAPMGQSGPAWWMAREAIDEAKNQVRGWPEGAHSRFRCDDRWTFGTINALLLYRDQIVFGMDEKDAAIALGLLDGKRQTDLARELSITQSAVSARQRGKGPAALLRAHEVIAESWSPTT